MAYEPGVGIARLRDLPTLPRLSGRTDGASLAEDLRAIHTTLDRLLAAVTTLDDQLSRRINEILLYGLAADRPAFDVAGRLYVATDTSALSFDDGTQWLTL